MVQVRQVIAGTPPVTGITTVRNLQDVNDSDRQDNALLFWNADTQKHEYYILAGFNKDSAFNQYSFSPDTLDIQNLTVTDSATIAYATINQGVLNGVVIGADSALAGTFTTLTTSNAQITGGTISGVTLTSASIDLNGGAIDGATIGATSPSTGAFTTLSASAGFSIAGLTFPTIDGISGQALVTDGNGNITFAFAGDSGGVVVNAIKDLTDVVATENTERSEGSYLRYDSANAYYEPRDFDSDALAAAKAGFSVTDAGGLGSLTYSDGTYTYTGPSNSDIRSLFSASNDLSYDSATGQFSIDVAVQYTASEFDSDFGSKSTTDLTEGTNLYYTTARFDTGFSGKSTTDLAEGTNLYYTDVRFDNRLGSKTTDNLTEGSTNLYYTTGRFDTRLAAKTTTDLAEGTNLYYTTSRADSAATDLITRAFVKALGIDLDDVTDNGATTTNAITVGNLTTTNGYVVHDLASFTTISSESTTLIDTTAHDSAFTSIEYLLQANNDSASESQISKILVTYNKSTVASTEYGTVYTGDSDLGTYTVDVSGDNIRLFFQRRPSNTITLKSTKTIIK